MFTCTECGTPNPLDSQFCKNCGHSLPADGLAEARIKLDEFVDQGNAFFTEGKTEEAMMVAEAAIESNPSHAIAYSLKGMCCERKGNLADALECYEKAISLNPDSAIDRIKVAGLRNRLATQIAEESVPDRKRAWFAALGAVLFISALGAIFIHRFNQPQKVALSPSNQSNIKGFAPVVNPPAGQTNGQTQSTGNQPQGQPSQNNSGQGNNSPTYASNPNSNLPPAINWPPSGNGNQLPLPGDPLTGQLGNEPVTPNPPPSNSNSNPPSNSNQQASPDPKLSNSGNAKPPAQAKPKEIIDIQVGGGSQQFPNQPGAQPLDSNGGNNNGIETLRKVAANQYQLGQYSQAASTYKQLIQMGGDSAGVRQKLGQIYSRLGQPTQAYQEYKVAVAKYQALISSGIDVNLNKAALATCQEELRLLGH